MSSYYYVLFSYKKSAIMEVCDDFEERSLLLEKLQQTLMSVVMSSVNALPLIGRVSEKTSALLFVFALMNVCNFSGTRNSHFVIFVT